MNLVKLRIGNETAVQGTFTHTAKLMGDALQYAVVRDPKQAPVWGSTEVPDEGDNAPINVECQWPVLAGYTSTGRPVLVFRSGEQGTNGWTGKSILYAAVGEKSMVREQGQSLLVQTTRTGPEGPKGDKGDPGPRGAPGVPGENATVTPEQIAALADQVAERVFSLPPAADHFGIPPTARSATRFQDMITILLTNQAVWQEFIKAMDEGVLGLQKGGYKPQAQ